MAKNASGSATRRTTEQDTSPSFHWSPASSPTIERWPRRTTARPLTRSQERVFILCGIAEEPTWPSSKPSVTSSMPAISRIVVARLDGAGRQLHERGDDVEVERARVDLADAGQHPLEAEVGGDPLLELRRACAASPSSRSSMSWAVPIGPLMPRSG